MEENKREIPNPIKREVRKRCGFGCVICGLPLYEYHHIKEWSISKIHNADEITLLCDRHHKEVTNGLMTRRQVEEANSNPFNILNRESSAWQLHFSGRKCTVNMGNNSFEYYGNGKNFEMIPLIVDCIPLIKFKFYDGRLFLNINLFDEKNNLILRIKDNELVYSISPWDIELVGKIISIREKSRKFLFRIEFDPPDKIKIDKGKFCFNGVEIIIESNHVLIKNNNTKISKCKAINCIGGLILGNTYPLSGFFAMRGINRNTV